jgi:formylglycine-generating enzyme required for sulfatase activity
MLEIQPGAAVLGRHPEQGFGWDNEFLRHSRNVPGFRVSRYKITNGQYLEFVEDGGPSPHYWQHRQGQWFYRGYDCERPLPRDWPVYVSFRQAEAWAQWAGLSLPTEAQFHRAAFGTPQGNQRSYPWGEGSPRHNLGNFNSHFSDLVPVTATPAGDSAFGVSQLVGNGWEWTRDVFEPFPGFKPNPVYPGYSANFFDGRHHVLKGGSCATNARLLRSSFRNWFRDEYPYAYTTFRVVEE